MDLVDVDGTILSLPKSIRPGMLPLGFLTFAKAIALFLLVLATELLLIMTAADLVLRWGKL